MSKENDEIDFLDALGDDERHRAFLVLGVACVTIFPVLGVRGLAILVLMAIFFSTRKPGHTSFMVHFQR
jgi:hypothetical protein